MTDTYDPTLHFDITGETIRIGDWLVIPATGGGMQPMRWGKVMGFSPQGWPKVQTFQIYGDWVRHPYRPTTLMIPYKTWIIDQSMLPKGLVNFIDTVFGGDVVTPPKKNKRPRKSN